MLHRQSSIRLALSLFALAPAVALGADWRSGNLVVIGPDEVIEGDLYVAANDIEILGTVHGDVFVAANSLSVSGEIQGGLTAAVASAEVSGSITEGARIFTSSAQVSGKIGRDLVVTGNTTELSRGAIVGGDLVGGMQRAVLLGAVAGKVELGVDRLRIGPEAIIGGSLRYHSHNDAEISYGAQISQNLGRVEPPDRSRQFSLTGVLWLFCGMVGLGLLLLWLLPGTTRKVVSTMRSSPGKSLGVGVLVLVGVPLVIALLFVPGLLLGVLTIPLVLGALFVVGLSAAGCFVSLWLGALIFSRKEQPLWAALLVGAFIIAVAMSLPFLGGLVAFVVMMLGLGAPALLAYRARIAQKATQPA